ncbi:ABC transporter permease subunit [Candidatus Persebacteraceae bacterium Df01]|jgi:glycine betaine/proline transport system permease protein|uniref:ABC transporter permease subunit n=1 Tax=Candidatus Doriopsillibacter californiensis TaxID=2970740 RepID=A0ABT7QK19_9GAMM|nr:ABC transporter permease subunit [Candidatus Persebacteraceae bacterium Df01]
MAAENAKFDFLNPFDFIHFPLEDWADGVKEWAFANRSFFRPLREPLDWMINNIEAILQSSPQLVIMLVIGAVAWQSANWRVGLLVVAALTMMGVIGAQSWGLAMTTLAVVISSVILCVLVGFPLGVLAGKSDGVNVVLRPILDTMQTIPAFVYLIPVVLLLGIGNVPGVIVTVVFAMPPLVRLTSLGIRQVNPHIVEAMHAFGSTPRQVLFKVEIPMAAPTIMAGLNQTLMLSLSMVVIASMIAVKGYGNEVLRAIGRLDAGKAIVGGVGIVLLAVVLDRITQGLGSSKRARGNRHWYEQGPVGLVRTMLLFLQLNRKKT